MRVFDQIRDLLPAFSRGTALEVAVTSVAVATDAIIDRVDSIEAVLSRIADALEILAGTRSR